jgi:hypothetical protein
MVDDVNLSEKYVWQEFLKEVNWYVSKNHETIVAQPVCAPYSHVHMVIRILSDSRRGNHEKEYHMGPTDLKVVLI